MQWAGNYSRQEARRNGKSFALDPPFSVSPRISRTDCRRFLLGKLPCGRSKSERLRKVVAVIVAKKVNIADIANALGLSRNTVSKALNGSSGITSETRQRVLDQAVRMNYKMMGTQVSLSLIHI